MYYKVVCLESWKILVSVAIELGFEQESYSTSEGGDVTVRIRKTGEVNETVCVSVFSESGTALGIWLCCIAIN